MAPPFPLLRGGFADRVRRARRLGAQARDRLARGLGLALKVAKPVLFLEAPGGRGRRLGGGDEAVPAPEVAFERDQALPGLELLGEPSSVRARDNANLPEAPRERGRGGHPLGEQWAGAASSTEASRSSPSAAPSAAS